MEKLDQQLEQEQTTIEKLDRIQEDVKDLEIAVGKLETQQTTTTASLTGIRNQIDNQLSEVRKEVSELRKWLMDHVFPRRTGDPK
jgi:predicted  nucleic acid-binding Zn-ribbon protein